MKINDTILCLTILLMTNVSCTNKQNYKYSDYSIAKRDSVLRGANSLAEANTELRKDLFKILITMNQVTDYALQLERDREFDRKGQPIAKQIQESMESLRSQLAEVRKKASDNKDILSEIDHLQVSFKKKQQEIAHLKTDIASVDSKLEDAIQKQRICHQNLEQEIDKLQDVNENRRITQMSINREKQNLWVRAGDQLISTVKELPGNKYDAIREVKRFLLNCAIKDCYNQAFLIDRSTEIAHEAKAKADDAQNLLNKIPNK